MSPVKARRVQQPAQGAASRGKVQERDLVRIPAIPAEGAKVRASVLLPGLVPLVHGVEGRQRESEQGEVPQGGRPSEVSP